MDTPSKLRQILQDTSWSQEELARQLGVPFATVNRWLNAHSAPRASHLEHIDNLYLSIIGEEQVNPLQLARTTDDALRCRLTIKNFLSNPSQLDNFTAHLTYHTNTIEGSTMTLQDVQQVLADNDLILKNKTAREQIETRNHRAALNFLLDKLYSEQNHFQWTKQAILDTHLRLMNTIISDAGTFRQHGVRILGSRVPLANPASVIPKLDSLLEELNHPTLPLIEHLAITHATFEQIHPFSDGNGRIGRLILLTQSLRFYLTPPLILKERKPAYCKYLELAQIDANFRPLQLFLAESILATNNILKLTQSPQIFPQTKSSVV